MSVERRDERPAGIPVEVPCVHPSLWWPDKPAGFVSRERVPVGVTGRRSCELRAPAAFRAGRDELINKDRKPQMMTRRRGMRLPREFLFTESGGSHAPRSLRAGALVVVAEWERAVLFRDGRVARVLEPGAHRVWQSRCGVRTVDMRPWVMTLPTQEAPTADGVPVKVTVAGHARVADAVVYLTATRVPEQSVYLAVQVAVRELLAATTLEELLGGRAGLGERLTESVRDAERAGVAIDELVIKDIILPGELKRAQAEVMIARAQGLAALERARGETAALRGLLNAARLASDNPALLQLRLMEHLGTSSGHTVIVGAAPGVVPLPAGGQTGSRPQA